MPEFGDKAVLVCGASRGIGAAVVSELFNKLNFGSIFATHRASSDITELSKLKKRNPDRVHLVPFDGTSIDDYDLLKSELLDKTDKLDLLLNCIGTLEEHGYKVERRLEDIDPFALNCSLEVNTLPTLLLAKSLKTLLKKSSQPKFISLSAKVGSIEDNGLGGWYSYRISKAALNMAIKNISIEFTRNNRNSVTLAIHPGTTRTELTKNFISSVEGKHPIHQPRDTARNLLGLIDSLDSTHTGKFYSWNGEVIPW